MIPLAASPGAGGLAVGLGVAVSASLLIAALIRAGRWIGSVEDRLDRQDTALQRLGTAVANNDQDEEGS
ncbi:hypothetical protein ABIA32_002676 [Streptacidiphilus sp. MAP12-20]|uniref:hypothetical protein n=1 Tax=Streptacidiphilus sp. MAP12-20 TaxID=3156299 RepID=UPI003519D5DB